MTVLKRPMFRRPSALPPLSGPMPVVRETYPVVKRDSGSPKEGEIVDDIELTDEMFEGSQSIEDKIGNFGKKVVSGVEQLLRGIKGSNFINIINEHLKKDQDFLGGKGSDYVLDEFDFSLLYPGVSFDSVTIEERTISSSGDDYKKLLQIKDQLRSEMDNYVNRAEGSPKEGEMTVEDYIAKGFDPYEFEADQAMDSKKTSYYERIINPEIIREQDKLLDKQVYPFEMEMKNKRKQSIRDAVEDLKKISSGEFSTPTLILDSFETANRYLGKEGALQVLRENNFHRTNSKVYRYLESLNEDFFNTFLYDDSGDFRGLSDYYYFERMPENMKKYVAPLMEIMSTDIVSRNEGSPMQGEMSEQEIMEDKQRGRGMFFGDSGEQALSVELTKLANGRLDILKMPVAEIIQSAIGEFGEDYVKGVLRNNPEYDKLIKMYSMPVNRQEGSPMQGEQVDVENVGIMDGFNQNPEQVAEQVLMEGTEAREQIDGADTYDELMRAIRGDNLSESDRRQELASVVGEKDAETTPDSVLVLVQPVMQMLNQESANTGIAEIESGALQMPQEPVGIATGGVVQKFNQGNLATRFEKTLPTYLGLVDRFSNPNQGQADALMALSRAGFNYGQGEDLTSAAKTFFDETYALGKQKATADEKMKTQLAMAALSQAGQAEIASIKNANEISKKKQIIAIGQTPNRDEFVARKLGFVKDAPTGVGGNPMGDQGPEYSEVVDWERFYAFYPKGTELQFNHDFTQFLGKRGSAIRYEGKGEDFKDGGIVKRASGTNEIGEVVDTEQIFDYAGVGTSTETDDINKLIARSNNTLKELYRMKEILVNNPEIGGAPGWVLETFQGLFTMVDQLDDAYLGDKFFDKEGKVYKTFNQKEIQEIQMLKNSIAQGIADLRSFKGTRQPTAIQESVSLKEIDPTGWFGGDVAKQKVDAVTEKVAGLLKEYIKLTTIGDNDEMNKQAIADKFKDIDAFVQSIINLEPAKGTSGFETKDSYTLDEIEQIIKLGDGDASAVELSDTTIEQEN